MKSKLKILVVFVVMFCATFVPESNHELFGDWKCKGSEAKWDKDDYWSIKGCGYNGGMSHDPSWHWGTRHWIWLLAGVTFSIWTIAEVIIDAQKNQNVKNKYRRVDFTDGTTQSH
jgi:hypothetical protein